MEKSESAGIVMMLMAAFPHSKTTPATSAVYEEALSDLDFGAAKRAVTRIVATAKFLPSIAEIREAALDLRKGPRRTGSEAWTEALAEVDRTGFYRVPRFTDPLLVEAMKLFGTWETFCSMPIDEHMSARARFIELYESLSKRGRADEQSGVPLPATKTPERIR